MESNEAREVLQAVESSPSLAQRRSGVEVAAGTFSVLLVLVGSAGVIISDPPRAAGILAAAGLLMLVVAWITRRAPGQSSWGPIDHAAQLVTAIAATLPAYLLIWPTDDNTVTGAWVASSIAALALAAFLALRWRR